MYAAKKSSKYRGNQISFGANMALSHFHGPAGHHYGSPADTCHYHLLQ